MNVEMGDAALTLEDQLHRGVAGVGGFKSDAGQAEAELLELKLAEEDYIRKVDYARMDPNAKPADVRDTAVLKSCG